MANITINSLPTASTIDATNDLLPIYTNSLTATQSISRNTYLNLSSQPVGLTDSQTLTNKTLTSPTINGATLSGTLAGTYTIGGTPTFPASVTQNTVVQTLTNKTLTSPTINSPTITNATISADTITGFSTSTLGTIYGLSISSGVLNSNNSVQTSNIQAAAITYAKLATGTTSLGWNLDAGATLTNSFVTHATLTATTHGGTVRIKWGAIMGNGNSGADRNTTVQVLCDGSATGISPATLVCNNPNNGIITGGLSYGFTHNQTGLVAGSHTWVVQYQASTASAVILGSNFLEVVEIA